MKDYERIYKVVNSIVKNEGADPAVCCIFFSAYGSYILSQHFKLNAQPKAGLAAYHVGNNDVVVFGEETERGLTGGNDAFHCWVEADGWILDFMAPAFSRLPNTRSSIPPKMFQKPLSAMASSPLELATPGGFYVEASPASTAKHMSILTQSMAYGDLAEICSAWFKKAPKKMIQEIGIADASGNQNMVSLTGRNLVGAW
ncbi:DUF2026 family protein [Billgrantia endophytica]|uniref:DUF2026 family protein n=1 Tax=Billgrantia endophytica TaxID=2033802 RepID=UPI00197AFE9D|nr:DUF2026 family protein [Halomonas endophytica]